MGDFQEERRRFGGHRPESPEYPGLANIPCGTSTATPAMSGPGDEGWPDSKKSCPCVPLLKAQKVNVNVLTPAEVELPMFLLALTAGLRQEELIALKWSDLDIKEADTGHYRETLDGTAGAGEIQRRYQDNQSDEGSR